MDIEADSDLEHNGCAGADMAGHYTTAVHQPPPASRAGGSRSCQQDTVTWNPPPHRVILVRTILWAECLGFGAISLLWILTPVLLSMGILSFKQFDKLFVVAIVMSTALLTFFVLFTWFVPATFGKTSIVSADQNGLSIRTGGKITSLYWKDIAGLMWERARFTLYSRSGELTPINLSGYSRMGHQTLMDVITDSARLSLRDSWSMNTRLYAAADCQFSCNAGDYNLTNPTDPDRKGVLENLLRDQSVEGGRVLE